jgi:hypothetical protein
MAYNGVGTFQRLYSWAADKVNNIRILASRMDAEMDGFATGLSNCVTKDGQTATTQRIPFVQGVSLGGTSTQSAAATMTFSGTNNFASGSTFTVDPACNFRVTATGSTTARDLADRLSEIYHVNDFGAVGDGVTDDSAALQAALTAAATRGGEVTIGDCRLYCNADIEVPAGVTLRGHWRTPGDLTSDIGVFGGVPATYLTDGSAIILPPSRTIIMGSGSALEGLLIHRSGIAVPEASAAAFSGTAVTLDGEDCTITQCLILGFALAVTSDGFARQKFELIYGDCTAGIKIHSSGDVTRINNCHFWPFMTTGQVTALSAHHRAGTAYELQSADLPIVTNCFCYGYAVGFSLLGSGGANLTSCVADGTQLYVNSKGFVIGNGTLGATGSKFVGCTAFSVEDGFEINLPVNDHIMLVAPQVSGVSDIGINVVQGDVGVTGGFLQASGININITSPVSKVDLSGGLRFNSLTVPIATLSRFVEIGDIDTGPYIGGAVSSPGPRQINSADPLVLTATGRFFEILGTTSFGSISAGYCNRQVTLKFTDALTVFDGAVINMAGDFIVTANDTLTLIHDGTNWLEVSRSAN